MWDEIEGDVVWITTNAVWWLPGGATPLQSQQIIRWSKLPFDRRQPWQRSGVLWPARAELAGLDLLGDRRIERCRCANPVDYTVASFPLIAVHHFSSIHHMAWLFLNAPLYLGVSAHVQLHALACFGDSTNPPPEETALGRVSHLNGSFKPLAPASWHATTSTRHQQESAKRQSQQHSAELQDRNSAGRLQLISLGNRDGFGSMAGETSCSPATYPGRDDKRRPELLTPFMQTKWTPTRMRLKG